MLVSQRFGALPLLGWVYDLSPWGAAGVAFTVDFLVILALMYVEGISPTKRTHYRTFLFFGGCFVPIYMFAAANMLQDAPVLDGFYTQPWFHAVLLAAGFLVSFGLEAAALKSGQYTWGQELSPSKLWHTIIFGVVAYWMSSVFIPLVIVRSPWWTLPVALVCLVGMAYHMYRDAVLPMPKDAHLDGSWLKWDWHRRQY